MIIILSTVDKRNAHCNFTKRDGFVGAEVCCVRCVLLDNWGSKAPTVYSWYYILQ